MRFPHHQVSKTPGRGRPDRNTVVSDWSPPRRKSGALADHYRQGIKECEAIVIIAEDVGAVIASVEGMVDQAIIDRAS